MPSERLSDEHLDAIERQIQAGRPGLFPEETAKLIAEIRERRAAEVSHAASCECWSQPHAGFCPAREG